MVNDSVVSERNHTMGVAKGIGILFIVLGHLLDADLAAVFYICHVPLFFIISGYFYTIPTCSFRKYLGKLFKANLVPYLWFTALLVVWVYIEYGSIAIPYILMYMSLQQHFSVAWFLAAMSFGILLFTLICKHCKSLRSIMIVSWFIGLLGILYAVYIRVLFFLGIRFIFSGSFVFKFWIFFKAKGCIYCY